MAITLGSIVVDLMANVGGFISGMDKASYAGKKATKEIHQSFDGLGEKLSGSLSGALSSLGQFGAVAGELSRGLVEAFEGIGKGSNGIAIAVTALGALGAAAVGAAAGFIELGKGGAELVEHLSQVSQKTGIGVRDLQIFEAAGKTVGLSLDDMVTGLRKFDQALLNTGKGAASQGILKTLGVTARDNKEALLQVADAFAKMDDGARKNSDAVALFGRSGLQLIPILNKGRDGIVEWEAAVDRLGPKIGKEAVEANEKYRKSVEELSLSWDKVKVDVEQSVVPSLAKASSWLANNFQSIKAGFAGGFGAGAILKAQGEAQQASTNAAKAESAAKDESLRKQELLTNSLKEGFEVMKLGGSAAYALSQARLELEGAVQNGLWKEASAIQSQLPGLEKAAALEAQRNARAQQLLNTYQEIEKSFAKGASRPLLKVPAIDTSKGTEALFGPQTKNPLEGAPDLGKPDFGDLSSFLADTQNAFTKGAVALHDFYANWNRQQKGTEDSINADYNAQLANWKDLLNNQAISQQQFNDVSNKLEKERQDGLKRLRQDNGTSTFRDAWQDMFKQIEDSGRDFARSITADIGNAIQSLNQQLAQFITTGKGLSLKSIGQSLETNLVGSILRKGESSLFGSLGKAFGFDSTKPDGSREQPFWVQMASPAGAAAGIGALPLGNLNGVASLLGNIGGGSGLNLGKIVGGIGSGIGGFFSNVASFFGGFLAEGGDTQPGKAYIVGEKRPELFIPRSAGTVVPNFAMADGSGKSTTITVHQHIHGVTDVDSFNKSKAQISSTLGNAVSRGQQRNGR